MANAFVGGDDAESMWTRDLRLGGNLIGSVCVQWTMPRASWLALAGLALILSACASPLATPTSSPPSKLPTFPAPSPAPSPLPTAVPGQIAVACDDPLPGHCLGLVAYSVRQLPAGVGRLSAVTATSINLCPTASPCIGPPHRGEDWVTFSFGDGSAPLEEWIVDMMGIRSVQSIGPNITPPPSAGPATAFFPLICEGSLSDADCTGAASGATPTLKLPRRVTVTPPPARAPCPPGALCTLVFEITKVVFAFGDGSALTVSVVRDGSQPTGWSPLPTQAP